MVIAVSGASFWVTSPTRLAKFFERLDFGRVLAEMPRSRRDMAERQPPQNFADRPLVIGNVPARQYPPLQIDAAPANHTVCFNLRTVFDQPGQLGFLLGRQAALHPGRFAVDQSLGALRIKAMHPIAQCLTVHRPRPRRRAAGLSLINRRYRQQAANLVAILCRPRRRAYSRRVPVLSQCDCRHRLPLCE